MAIRAPLSVWAVPSYQKLQQMVDISAATRDGCRAKNGLAAILQLRLSASEAMEGAAKARRRTSAPLATEDPATVSYLEHLKSGAKLVRIGPAHSHSHSPGLDGSSPAGLDMSPELRSIEFKSEYNSRPSSAAVPAAFMPGLNVGGADFASNQWLNSLVWQQPHGDGLQMGVGVGVGVVGELGLGGGVDMDTSIALGIGSSQHELLEVLVNRGHGGHGAHGHGHAGPSDRGYPHQHHG